MLLFANVDFRGLTTLIAALGSISIGLLVLLISGILAVIISNTKGISKRSHPAADCIVFGFTLILFNIIPFFVVSFASEETQGYFDQFCWYYTAITFFISLLIAFSFRRGRIARNATNTKIDQLE